MFAVLHTQMFIPLWKPYFWVYFSFKSFLFGVKCNVLTDKTTCIVLNSTQPIMETLFLSLTLNIFLLKVFFLLYSSVLTDETTCTVLNSTLTKDINCSYNCGSDCWRSSKYPCLQVYVSLNTTGRIGLLSHSEEMLDVSSEVNHSVNWGRPWTLIHSVVSPRQQWD